MMTDEATVVEDNEAQHAHKRPTLRAASPDEAGVEGGLERGVEGVVPDRMRWLRKLRWWLRTTLDMGCVPISHT